MFLYESGQVLCTLRSTFSLCAFIFDLVCGASSASASKFDLRSRRDDRTLGAVRARSFAPAKLGAASARLGGSSGCRLCRLCRLCLIAHEAS